MANYFMTLDPTDRDLLTIRPLQYRDLEAIDTLAAQSGEAAYNCPTELLHHQLQRFRRWYGVWQVASCLPLLPRHELQVLVAEQPPQILGAIGVLPANRRRSTWRVEQVLAAHGRGIGALDVGSQLVRQCLEAIWEARTWIAEVEIQHKSALGLYRRNGFQPLAQMTYWSIAPETLAGLAQREPQLPNLLPVSNADAHLICQLDTLSMPPLLRQVFDRQDRDFKLGAMEALSQSWQRWFGEIEIVRAYVFEPQRKAAIGYFALKCCRCGTHPHEAELIVHPAYTWLYPELLSQMAQAVQGFAPQALQLVSADYQSEREEYLEELGAQPLTHTLLMSRSVWHKLREVKRASLDKLQLSGVLQGLQPGRTPIPSRFSEFSASRFPQSDRSAVREEEWLLPEEETDNNLM